MLNHTYLDKEDTIFVVVANDKRYKGVCKVCNIPRDIIKKLRNIEKKEEVINICTKVADTFVEYIEELTEDVKFIYTLIRDYIEEGGTRVPKFLEHKLQVLEQSAWDRNIGEDYIEELFYNGYEIATTL